MKNRINYVLTHHLRERFVQRSNKKFEHMQSCKIQNCTICANCKIEINHIISSKCQDLDDVIYNNLEQSKENRCYINNSSFMENYYNKYGYDQKFEFLVFGKILFVVVWEKNQKIVVTCMSSKDHIAGKGHVNKINFKKTNHFNSSFGASSKK